MKKETRKVSVFGNSLGVSIPKKVIDELEIKRGDEIVFEVEEDYMILKRKKKLEDELDVEMLQMLQETFDEHNELFKRLK